MATHMLQSDTLISALMSSGGTLASGDTIELSGHALIIDADAVSSPVTLTNSGATAHLELRDGGRIKLNASLPTSICPWVDPANPLPESNYTTGLTANASAEIQLNGSFGLGGGPASLPTATRAGGFWALCLSSSDSSHVTFDRDFPLHPGDIIVNATSDAANTNNTCTVVSYDKVSRTAQIDNTGSQKTKGDLWFMLCGGVLLFRTGNTSSSTPVITNTLQGGTINFLGYAYGSGAVSIYAIAINSNVCATRIAYKMRNGGGNASKESSGLLTALSSVFARDVAADKLCTSATGKRFFIANELAASTIAGNEYDYISFCGGFVNSLDKAVFAKNATIKTAVETPNVFYQKRCVNCQINGIMVSDTQYEISGTVSRVARTDFPTDTDLPDAFYFAPATASDVPWRYEDYWVRKGETLRLSCRAMRGGDNGTARVAIGEMAIWVPAEGMPTLAEWVMDSGEPLVWRGGQIAWTNDTDEDRQVRVWSMGRGIHGAYIRVWQATGGAM